MSAGDVAVLIASVASCAAVVGLLVVIGSLRRQTRALQAVADELGRRTMPLVADAHRAVDQAATELERVGAVLDSTESVHATVDSASKLAYRAFANPVVKLLAVRAGAASGLRRFASGSVPPAPPSAPSDASANGR
ncbi:MAG TPA: hypothetical protein VG032_02960 [Acidimicrobiales bacterium]|jgi:hypothetical protein|nr:hypothetical protein [Acidimicrobiales bacterium]